MKLLLVEDNQRLAERISEKLKNDYILDLCLTGEEALNLVGMTNYETIILDLGLPDMHGSSVCKAMRDKGINTPILILTGSHSINDKVELLTEGADDYLPKPFEVAELKARITALSRRNKTIHIQTKYVVGPICLNSSKRTVHHSDREVELRRKEFDILEYLMKNRGRTVTREMIMNHVWESDTKSWLNTIDVHMKHLRDKLEKPNGSHYIKTIYGVGYRMTE